MSTIDHLTTITDQVGHIQTIRPGLYHVTLPKINPGLYYLPSAIYLRTMVIHFSTMNHVCFFDFDDTDSPNFKDWATGLPKKLAWIEITRHPKRAWFFHDLRIVSDYGYIEEAYELYCNTLIMS